MFMIRNRFIIFRPATVRGAIAPSRPRGGLPPRLTTRPLVAPSGLRPATRSALRGGRPEALHSYTLPSRGACCALAGAGGRSQAALKIIVFLNGFLHRRADLPLK